MEPLPVLAQKTICVATTSCIPCLDAVAASPGGTVGEIGAGFRGEPPAIRHIAYPVDIAINVYDGNTSLGVIAPV